MAAAGRRGRQFAESTLPSCTALRWKVDPERARCATSASYRRMRPPDAGARLSRRADAPRRHRAYACTSGGASSAPQRPARCNPLLTRRSEIAVRLFFASALATAMTVATLLTPTSARAQSEAELKALNEQVVQLYQAGKYAEAIPLAERYAEAMNARRGPDSPEYATALNNLAQLLQATNRLAEAEPLMRRALAIDENEPRARASQRRHRPQQPGRAAAGHQPAGRGRAADAPRAGHRREELRPRASRRRQRPQQPGAVAPGHQPAGRGRAADRRALAIDEKSFGPEHPNVAIGLNNLAQLLQATNRLAEAEPLMRRALAIDEKSFGPEHPNVAIRPQQPGRSCSRPRTGWPRPSR